MKISNLSYKNILNMKTQAKNTLAFINIALLLLFFFGISSCSALQIGKDIKTRLFQENGNVFTFLLLMQREKSFGVIQMIKSLFTKQPKKVKF